MMMVKSRVAGVRVRGMEDPVTLDTSRPEEEDTTLCILGMWDILPLRGILGMLLEGEEGMMAMAMMAMMAMREKTKPLTRMSKSRRGRMEMERTTAERKETTETTTRKTTTNKMKTRDDGTEIKSARHSEEEESPTSNSTNPSTSRSTTTCTGPGHIEDYDAEFRP
jgi:hypothetical protein